MIVRCEVVRTGHRYVIDAEDINVIGAEDMHVIVIGAEDMHVIGTLLMQKTHDMHMCVVSRQNRLCWYDTQQNMF